MAQRQGFLKEGGLALFLSNFFRVYHFYIQKLFLTFQNCAMLMKKDFFLPPYFMKKSHSTLSKNEPENIPQKIVKLR